MPLATILALSACLAATLAQSVAAIYAPSHASRIARVSTGLLCLAVAGCLAFGLSTVR